MNTQDKSVLADIDYDRIVAEAHAERSRILRAMFVQAKSYIAGLFQGRGAAATQN